MNPAAVVNILSVLQEALEEQGYAASVSEKQKTPLLDIHFGSGSEYAPQGASVVILNPTREFLEADCRITVYDGLEQEKARQASLLLPDLNRYLRLGYFGCDVEKGCFFYRFHFLIDGLNRSTLQKTFIGSFSLCTSAAARGKEILQPLIKGETTIEELLEYENTIFQ